MTINDLLDALQIAMECRQELKIPDGDVGRRLRASRQADENFGKVLDEYIADIIPIPGAEDDDL